MTTSLDTAVAPIDIVPSSRLRAELPALAARFAAAQPVPHIVIDDFLDRAVIDGALSEFPTLDSIEWTHYVHVNERKFGATDRRTFGPRLGAVVDALNSATFVEWLARLTGVEELISDDTLEGGGLHQSARGGYLNIHADFTAHPHHSNWRRRLNLLVYLNREWREEYGGHLELWDRDMRRCVTKILPVYNRAVIFRTDPDAYHGHPDPLGCPDGMTRKSLALYYYTREASPTLVRATWYRARPGDGSKRIWIGMDNLALRVYDRVKRVVGLDDKFASRTLQRINRIVGGRTPKSR